MGYLSSSRLVYRQNKLPKMIIYLVPEALVPEALGALPFAAINFVAYFGGALVIFTGEDFFEQLL